MFDFASLERRIASLEKNRGAELRFGRVSEVDEKTGTARVHLPDANGTVTKPLRVLAPRTTKDQEQHLPDLSAPVACLFSGQGREEGVVLGSYNSTNNPAPGMPAHIWFHRFADGTVLFYDREKHELSGEVKGSVNLSAEKDANIKSGQHLLLEGAAGITLRTPALKMEGVEGGKMGSAQINADFDINGQLRAGGDVSTSGIVEDKDGNVRNR